ncbi:hypothetical protein DAEQUDRAFT_434544 [Daedalea quercina L-15889]|uniref:Uncharacterized protein n=1 Tax=Daedalea quercina L-15889 TaxID=1314783 RepID=A0A165NCR3_9APHY|nr:hypothetical protein DAEQUDRAFT_434544 [Daedalea quercina L-15889]
MPEPSCPSRALPAMDTFPSILHLIIGFFLGVLIDTGGEIVRTVHTTLVAVFRFFISLTFAELVGFLPFVALNHTRFALRTCFCRLLRLSVYPSSLSTKDPHVARTRLSRPW